MGSNLHLEVGGGVLPMATVARGNLARLRRLLNNCGAARAALPHLLLFDATFSGAQVQNNSTPRAVPR